jgi:hypothetical protein
LQIVGVPHGVMVSLPLMFIYEVLIQLLLQPRCKSAIILAERSKVEVGLSLAIGIALPYVESHGFLQDLLKVSFVENRLLLRGFFLLKFNPPKLLLFHFF